MSWLSLLKNAKEPGTDATKPTKPADDGETVGSVGFVASPQRVFENSRPPANDDAPPEITGIWPHGEAWNTQELFLFARRVSWFVGRGLCADAAERLADALVQRDREGGDRRLCLECRHLRGIESRRCGNWRAAGIAMRAADADLSSDLVMQMQRCHGFEPAIQPADEGAET